MSHQPLNVAVPWSLSHYIPLNGFHPLYRALVEQRPQTIDIFAWDNVDLCQALATEPIFRQEILSTISRSKRYQRKSLLLGADTQIRHEMSWGKGNQLLTQLLPGDIEFHHTAPFPSMTRPFVFHCESFAPIFHPFAHQGGGQIKLKDDIKSHYSKLFSSPLCLGIFSHVPSTLQNISQFFSSAVIDAKLFASPIGLSELAFSGQAPSQQLVGLSNPVFLFVNSANQNPANFFSRGGHIALRFWQEYRALGHRGKLYMRCRRPTDEDLSAYGVDTVFLRSEDAQGVVWIEDFLSNMEINKIISHSHFMLLPSASLHSASILSAMQLGAVPVVTDTVGTSIYVQDGENGIVLNGTLEKLWHKDSDTGTWYDEYIQDEVLDNSLVNQLIQRVFIVLNTPDQYWRLRENALYASENEFSGRLFSEKFWSHVLELMIKFKQDNHVLSSLTPPSISQNTRSTLSRCCMLEDDWPRVFESVTQPLKRIYTGMGRISELMGNYIYTVGDPRMCEEDWSVLQSYLKPGAPKLRFVREIRDLKGCYMSWEGNEFYVPFRRFTTFLSKMLRPWPKLHRIVGLSYKRVEGLLIYLRHWRNDQVHIANLNAEDVPQLIIENYCGYNVIMNGDIYYAIPVGEGGFDIGRIQRNEYSKSFQSTTIRAIKMKIEISPVLNRGDEMIHLAKENINGFNIVELNSKYYAIPLGSGAFDIEDYESGKYGCKIEGKTIKETERHIKKYLVSAKASTGGEHQINHERDRIYLVRDGVDGFNILAYQGVYYGVRQEDGVFDLWRLKNKDFTRLYVGQTEDEIVSMIRNKGIE